MPTHCKDIATLNTLFTELRYHVNKVTLSAKFVTLFTINSIDFASIDNDSYACITPFVQLRRHLSLQKHKKDTK
jgi:hypothetical protein